IGETIASAETPERLDPIAIDEPTVSMQWLVNDSPFAGTEGKFVTSRNIKDRLERELRKDVALRVRETEQADRFEVSGRGELHLSILAENMRREGYEFALSRPQVILKQSAEGKVLEPYEALVVDIDDELYAITSTGGVIRTTAKEVRKAGRQTKGVRLMNLGEGASLVAVARNAEEAGDPDAGGAPTRGDS
ncbi:MAG: hypothetical protein M3325_09570, partial [Actinomycetota bacterium]|nr:hypothetical protein [Actinomycetota bacterium]